jgi:hypothetical protein
MTMFIYLFPIFCFGLMISGIVYLGFLEAREQAKRIDQMGEEDLLSSEDYGLKPRRLNHPRAVIPDIRVVNDR